MEDVQRAAGAALPPDFESWPKPARWFLRTIVSLPTWKAHGFALCTDDQLAEWRQADPRTIRRMRIEAAKRGEVARVFVRRGSTLPDGERVRRGLWILIAGEAYRARAAPPHPAEFEPSPLAVVPPTRPVCPPEPDNLSADRSLDPLDHKNINAPCPPTASPPPIPQPATEPERSTSVHSHPETKIAATSDERAAHSIASHYAKATGRRWHRGIDHSVLAFVLRFVREMVGSEANKIQRATAVIDRVVDEAGRKGTEKPPSLAYVFHPQIFWVRLERLERLPKPPPSLASADTSRKPPATEARPLARAVHPNDDDPAAIRAMLRESLGLPPETGEAAA
jgi:hypothetical protein